MLFIVRLQGNQQQAGQRSREQWVSLGKLALECLEVDLALRIYRELRDTAMVDF